MTTIEAKQEEQREGTTHAGAKVKIQVGEEYCLSPGHHTVAAIKHATHVPQDYELDQVVNGKFIPLPDDGSVILKGGEEFFGHIKRGGSS